MDWRTKAKAFRILDAVPFGAALHYQLQRRLTKSLPRSSDSTAQVIEAAKWITSVFEKSGRSLGVSRFLEIGAGWDLALPIALSFLGVGRITTVDVTRLAKIPLIAHQVAAMAQATGKSAPRIANWSDVEKLNIEYVAPSKVRDCGIGVGLIDCFISFATLEHIPFEDLTIELAAAKRLLRDNGKSIHIIDYSDHYAHSDGSLSHLNFLRYSDRQWAQYNTSFQYVNRLRNSEYLEIFKSSGFVIEESVTKIAPPEADVLSDLAPQFRRFTTDDLFAVQGRIVARPQSDGDYSASNVASAGREDRV
jgi:hypothetical protein